MNNQKAKNTSANLTQLIALVILSGATVYFLSQLAPPQAQGPLSFKPLYTTAPIAAIYAMVIYGDKRIRILGYILLVLLIPFIGIVLGLSG